MAEIARIVSEANGLCEAQPAGALTGSVLIADDDPLNREVLRRLLKQQGHTVAEAADGGEALRILATRSFDVLLLDILMIAEWGIPLEDVKSFFEKSSA